MKQNTGQAETLGHTARKTRDQRVSLVAQIDQVEHFFAALPAGFPPDPVRRREKFQVLDHLHILVNTEEVGHIADHPP